MSQQYTPTPAGEDNAGAWVITRIPNNFDALLTDFSGPSEPTFTRPGMRWLDTGLGLLKRRNPTDDGWIVVGGSGTLGRCPVSAHLLSLSATSSRRLIAPIGGFWVERLTLLSATASTSSSGNEWTAQLRNVTQSLNLFSVAPGTFTPTDGVGGGVELAVDTPWVATPDQNPILGAGDVLRIDLTAVGSVTTLAELAVVVEGFPLG